MAGAAHAMWASDLAYGAQKGMGDILMNFGKESGQVKPRLSNGMFQINGLLLVVSELVF